jgi:hypothetical protein
MKLIRFRNGHSAEPARIILPLLNDAERYSGRGRGMSAGTRVDLMLLALWLGAAGLAALGMFVYLLYSYLPVIARA